MNIRLLCILLLIGLIFFQCKPKSAGNLQSENSQVKGTGVLPADFKEFYQKFHTDSAYQLQHIVWPLAGESSIAVDSMNGPQQSMSWNQESWKIHHLPTNDFEQEYEVLNDGFIIERIRTPKSNYGLERRFAKTNNEWQLIFYSDMHEMGRPSN